MRGRSIDVPRGGRVMEGRARRVALERLRKEADQEFSIECSTGKFDHAACRWDDCLCYCHEAAS